MPLLNAKLGIDFSDYIADRTLNFTGREWVFEALQNWLTDPKGDRFFLLTGEPGSGKTAISARLAQFAQGAATYPGLEAGFLQAVHFCSARDSVWTDPKEFARSLALQLAASIPEFGLALKDVGEKTNNINVDLTVGTAQNSNIQGVVIQNLTLSGLTGQEAFTQVVVNPLRQIQQEGFSQPVTILVDSLDEALTHDGESTIVGLVSKLSADVKLRLILTSRNEGRVKEKLEEYEELFLSASENLDKNQQDVRAYINAKFRQEKPLQNSLQTETLDQEVLTTNLIEKSEGNFLYVRFLLEAVALEQQSFANLDGLPQGLDELYYSSLRRVVELGKKDWSEVYAPVMGVLLAAQESLTESQIRAFTKLKESVVWDCLTDLQQFLDEIESEDEETLYKLYHQSVTDFLGKKELRIHKGKAKKPEKVKNRYYLPGQEQHQRLLAYYRPEGKLWAEVQLEKIDPYGRRYLAQHLVKADRVEELHTLLSLEKDGKNAWFKVKDDAGDTAGFLSDVELAWSQAAEACDYEPGKSIGLQCRYALIKTSINSLAGIPKDLMVALVKHQYWKPVKALAYVRQIPDPKQRFESLIALANQIPDVEPLKYQVLQSALQITEQIKGEGDRASALTALGDKMPDVLPLALKTAQAIQDDSSRASALTVLGGKMLDALPLALETAQAIQNEYSRASALEELFPKITLDLLRKALQAVQAIQDEYCRASVLSALVPKLTSDLFPIALEIAQALQDKFSHTKVLIVLGDKLPSVLPQALEIAQLIQGEDSRAQALIAMVPKLTPDLLFKALDIAQVIQSEFLRASALIVLSDKMPHLLPEALEAAQGIQGNYSRARALTALADKLPGILPLAIEAAQLSIQEGELGFYRPVIDLIVELVSKLPDTLLPLALETVQVIQEDYFRADVLVALVPNLTDTFLPHILQLAQDIQELSRIELLTALGNKWPTVLPLALGTAHRIQDEIFCARVLAALGDKDALLLALKNPLPILDKSSRCKDLSRIVSKLTPDLLPEALEAIQAIKYEHNRSEALTEIIPRLTSEFIPKALKIAVTITDEGCRSNVLLKITNELPEALPEILEFALNLQDKKHLTKVLVVLIPKLPIVLLSPKLPQILGAIRAIQKEEYRIKALIVLISKVPETFLSQIFETTQAIRNKYFRAQVLAVLGGKMPELLPLVLKISQNIEIEYFRAHILTMLGSELSYELLPQALANIYSIQHEGYRAWCLRAFVPNLPHEFLPQVLESAQTIQSEHDRAQLLMVLSEKLPEVLPQALVSAQAIQSNSLRAQLLMVLSEKLPEVLPQALVSAQAIQKEIGRAQALVNLVPLIPEALPQALVAVQAVQKDKYRAHIITMLADTLAPELLREAVETAQEIQDASYRAQALTALALPLVHASNCFELLKNLLHFLSARTRSELLSDLTALTPVIFASGEEATAETAQAIRDVSRWWA